MIVPDGDATAIMLPEQHFKFHAIKAAENEAEEMHIRNYMRARLLRSSSPNLHKRVFL